MSFSEHIITTIVVGDGPKFKTPVPVDGGPIDRDTTTFVVVSEYGTLSFAGTYDELLNYFTSMATIVMSWPLISGHSEWFGDRAEAIQEEVNSNGNVNGQQGTPGSDIGDRIQPFGGGRKA
jgi:hypothetical protein